MNLNDLTCVHPNLLVLLTAFIHFCDNWNLPCKITSIKEDAAGRKFKQHAQGRAFDASIQKWPEFYIYKLRKEFNEKYVSISAISASDYKKRAVVYHQAIIGKEEDGTEILGASHLHFQVKR